MAERSRSAERFEAPECMFQLHLVDIEQPGVAEMLFETAQSAAVDVRAELCLEKEMKQLYLTRELNRDPSRLNEFKIRIGDPPCRKYWSSGGAVLLEIMKA
ncbi:hypothetical protein BGW80DRAFT_1460621 [Lactifluus volemus]|nr:hypothetical protein BGW80DRAFT_1460621 [Lactifluus volemus]